MNPIFELEKDKGNVILTLEHFLISCCEKRHFEILYLKVPSLTLAIVVFEHISKLS